MWTCPTLAYTGRSEEAVQSAERAISLSPEDPLLFRYHHFLSIAHYVNGAFDEAAHWGVRAASSNPDYLSNLAMTIAAHAALDRAEEANPLVERLLLAQPDFRVCAVVGRVPFSDENAKRRYGQHLTAAGLPL